MEPQDKWANKSPAELVDMAQAAFDESTPNASLVLLAAAQVQATAALDYTIQMAMERMRGGQW